MANKKNNGSKKSNETMNAQPQAEQVINTATENATAKPAGLAALDALFAEAGMSTTKGGKEKTEAYQKKTLDAEKRVEGECINKQHEAWSEAYQKQRVAAVKLGKYRTQVLGLPAGCRKFSQGKFRPAANWEEAKAQLSEEALEKYLALEAAVEAIA